MTRLDHTFVTREATRAVMTALSDGGHTALFVGGCVRNALLGARVDDIDIATDAHPDAVIALTEAAGLKPVPTGVAHGTVTVVSDGMPHEVTTFRRDVETDGRHAVVAFADTVEEDAARRDFTMNALYADGDGNVLDPMGTGLSDLSRRHVRFIGEAARRIAEDYLRILRFFRFHAWYGDAEAGLDAEGLAACADAIEGLAGLSRERVGHEMRKLLAAPDPAPGVASMQACGALGQVLPGADAERLAPLVHLEQQTGTAPDALRRLACLGGDETATRLRLSKIEARRLDVLRAGIGDEAGTAELAYRHGAEAAHDIELLRAVTFEAPLPATLEADLIRGAEAVFPVRAADLMPEYSGAELGAKLADLERRWIASQFTLDRDALLA
ncbi:poly(A) polymerase [Tranquillimonas rosea]|uniref:Poly(A) polymerase n=1 Tax=Tranquillimonas rosea TaxID=641238 RepID=A0A1H9UHB3_9RHOB|nr:CCA tRNA nucleotidyltransferase [Tranquillimonas rosea]SES08668.1 poly(A) polymerase [Tranquillimonas rosea]